MAISPHRGLSRAMYIHITISKFARGSSGVWGFSGAFLELSRSKPLENTRIFTIGAPRTLKNTQKHACFHAWRRQNTQKHVCFHAWCLKHTQKHVFSSLAPQKQSKTRVFSRLVPQEHSKTRVFSSLVPQKHAKTSRTRHVEKTRECAYMRVYARMRV